MDLTEQMLYEAAEDAAARFLDTLPDREACAHDFSPEFEARMDALLRQKKRGRGLRRRWRQALVLAAVLCALAAGVTAGAQRKHSYQMLWSNKDGVVSYSIRVVPDSFTAFRPLKPGYLPEGFVLEKEYLWEGTEVSQYEAAYHDGTDRRVVFKQSVRRELSGILSGDYETKEVSVGDASAMLCRDKSGGCTLIWVDGPNILELGLYGKDSSEEELLRIAENLHY